MAFNGRMSKCHGLSNNVQGSYKYSLCKFIMGHCVMCRMHMHSEIWNLHSMNLCFDSTYIFLILSNFHKNSGLLSWNTHLCFLPNSLIMLSS